MNFSLILALCANVACAAGQSNEVSYIKTVYASEASCKKAENNSVKQHGKNLRVHYCISEDNGAKSKLKSTEYGPIPAENEHND